MMTRYRARHGELASLPWRFCACRRTHWRAGPGGSGPAAPAWTGMPRRGLRRTGPSPPHQRFPPLCSSGRARSTSGISGRWPVAIISPRCPRMCIFPTVRATPFWVPGDARRLCW